MEKQKVAEGDFDGASALRVRRLSLQTGTAVAGGTLRSPFSLRAATAKAGSGLDFLDTRKEIVRFRRTGALMEWDLTNQLPGTYRVNLVCAVMGAGDENDLPDALTDPRVPLPVRDAGTVTETDAGGVVEFRKLTNLKEGGTVLRRSIRSTGGWAKSRVLPLGTVELDSRLVKFSLRAVEALPAGLMDFHRLELVPVAKPGGTSVAVVEGGAGPKELVRLQEVYQKQFADQTKNATAIYLKSLGELEVLAGRSGDNETLALVRQERKRFERAGLGSPPSTVTLSVTGGADPASSHLLPVTEKLYLLLRGEAKLTNQGDFLTRLRPAGTCEIVWKIAALGVPSGTYQVELEGRMAMVHGGTAALRASSTGGEPGPALSFEVPQGSFDKNAPPVRSAGTDLYPFKTDAGVLTIPKGSQFLTMRVVSLINPTTSLCELKSLRLTPVASSP